MQVRDRDTLTSLAARFDTTPSELTKLNRLATQFIFPGQTLLVPDKRKGEIITASSAKYCNRDNILPLTSTVKVKVKITEK